MEPRFSNIIRFRRLFENQVVRDLKQVFPWEWMYVSFNPFQGEKTTSVKYFSTFYTINCTVYWILWIKTGRYMSCLILIKGFLFIMMEKENRSKHFVCLALKTSKTLKVKIPYQKLQKLIMKQQKNANWSVTSKIVEKRKYKHQWHIYFRSLKENPPPKPFRVTRLEWLSP